MSMMEMFILVVGLGLCGFGVSWAIWDLDRQVKMYMERCESLEDNKDADGDR